MNNIPIILGPTGSGKTQVADILCRKINGEIISADSRQVYRYLDVGTNKIQTESKQHLINIINPDERFSSGDFFELAVEKIKEIRRNKKIPVVAGGTGLYIKTLIDGGMASLPTADWDLRKKLATLESETLYKKLLEADPLLAEKNKGNTHRLIRALEVYYKTGVPMSRWHAEQKRELSQKFFGRNFFCVGIGMKKDLLIERIKARSAWMVENGIIEETKSVLDMGYPRTSPGFGSIGYSRVFDYLGSKISRADLVEGIFSDTRKYIKRQMTWFKKYPPNIIWIDISDKSVENAATEIVLMLITRK